ncbi:cytochrome P450 [Nonomuraea sp. NPDC050536]|uniref:cytochrome P450 n=1 Tax=Nonomuraea sp. NPDC050536 TaxID=3364366 RepID=UPI0037CB4E05
MSEEGRADPTGVCADLRSEGAVLPTGHGLWFTTTYIETREVLRNEICTRGGVRQRAVRDPRLWGTRLFEWEQSVLPFIDPPEHTRLRRLIGAALSVSYMEDQRPRVARFVRSTLLRGLEAGQIDLIGDLAAPLPFWITAEMFDIPPSDRDMFHSWTLARAESLQRITNTVPLDATNQALAESEDYLLGLIDKRAHAPGDDLLSRMISVEIDGDRLGRRQIAANVNQLFSAGLDTVKYAIGNAFHALTSNPDQWLVLCDDPRLAANAVEETLRYEGGFLLAPVRVPTRDLHLGGFVIPAGDRICPILYSANRDPARYREPDRFLVARENPRPLTFGGGIHRCIGAALARVQAQECLRLLATEAKTRRLTVEEASLSYDIGRRGPEKLSISFS